MDQNYFGPLAYLLPDEDIYIDQDPTAGTGGWVHQFDPRDRPSYDIPSSYAPITNSGQAQPFATQVQPRQRATQSSSSHRPEKRRRSENQSSTHNPFYGQPWTQQAQYPPTVHQRQHYNTTFNTNTRSPGQAGPSSPGYLLGNQQFQRSVRTQKHDNQYSTGRVTGWQLASPPSTAGHDSKAIQSPTPAEGSANAWTSSSAVCSPTAAVAHSYQDIRTNFDSQNIPAAPGYETSWPYHVGDHLRLQGHPQAPSAPAPSARHLTQIQSAARNRSGTQYLCPQNGCHKGFDTQSALSKHERNHREGDFRCDMCDHNFVFAKDLRRHNGTKAHRGKIRESGRSPMESESDQPARWYCSVNGCKYCREGFGRKDHYDRHMRRKHPHHGSEDDGETETLLPSTATTQTIE